MRFRRLLLPIVIICTALASAATGGFGHEPGSECLLSLTSQGFYTHVVRIVMRASGALEIGIDTRFKACAPFGKTNISLRHPAALSDYRATLAAIRSGERTNIPIENVTTDSEGGRDQIIQYVIPSLSPGDEWSENIEASVPPVLFENQLWVVHLSRVIFLSAYNVLFESERNDASVRLVDPAKLLIPVHDAPTRKEWRSQGAVEGALPGPRLEITTLGDWAKVAQLLRAAYFIDSQRLDDLQATGIEPVRNPEALYKRFAEHFSPKIISETRFEPPSLASILQAKGGDCKALTFLLLNVFRWAGIEAELVITSTRQAQLTDVFSLGDMDHVLVYVPSLDRYFEPTLPADSQRRLDTIIRTKDRLHVAAPPTDKARFAGGCADYCILAGSEGGESDRSTESK